MSASARANVALAIPELDAGGPDRVIHELLCHLPRDRFRLTLVTHRAGGRYYEDLPDDVERVVIGQGRRYPVRAFARWIDTARPDLMFTTLRMNLTAALAQPLQRHRPVLVSRQANAVAADFALLKRRSLVKHRIAERLVRWSLGRPDALVAQSRDMGDELARMTGRGEAVHVIGNPVDRSSVEAQYQAQAVRGAPLAPGAPAIVAAGRLMPQKGFDVLLRAMPAVLARHRDARLAIHGEGPDRTSLEALASELGITDSVVMPGFSDTLLATIAGSDVFVSSSRYEGFSNAILEAMALGVPVAATACTGATREMILDGETGFLAEPENSAALADAMLRAIGADRSTLALRAATHLDTNFARASIIGEYARLFDRLLDSRP
ncbi:glycosyltransferase [Sphingomonas baiyangensis]|nr:glycosyltransferase [Sphingomonas baiyangensis]